MWKRIILWSVTILWAVGIFCFSAQPAKKSAAISGKINAEIIHSLTDNNVSGRDMVTFESKAHNAVRKTAHVGLYLVLGALTFLLYKTYCANTKRGCLIALGASVLYGASDELHQLFVSGRSGQITDVLLDGFGAVIGIFLVVACGRIWKTIIIKKR
ncbi:MAG: hypothetical protein E7400_04960 [Ruminococcaceae bacterium]|nr:hypothetical protein [Oscillospiraceae bacterium]